MSKCIRVPKPDGEKVRNGLMASGLLDLSARIRSEGGFLLMPVLGDVDGFETEEAEFEEAKRRITDYRECVQVPDELCSELPASFDVIGDVAVVKVPDSLLPYKNEIGRAMASASPGIRAVMRDAGVKGEFRIRDLEQIAGSGGSETTHREFGLAIRVDPAKVYFNPRLATERRRVASLVKPGEVIIDMFAGVAPFGLVICRHASPDVVYSIDLNPDAEPFARLNMEANRISRIAPMTGDASEVVKGLPDADRIIMNLPHTADRFLPDALKKVRKGGTVHLHKMTERADIESFAEGLRSSMGSLGLDMHIAEVLELKTYSPTAGVYVLDIVKD
ncbi:MAG: class I SAM-dependent methyltransferase family protein [Candidatus Methanoplasma sp.]|jgi:tRNA (guanine37-N1)-methyltransferase|nr:class I SAM-dependent methyltransferase family protein [Candidatus Methanoplasma sp.]